MSKFFENIQEVYKICPRITNDISALINNFSKLTLHYLDEQIINYLLDSLKVDKIFGNYRQDFNDYFFCDSPLHIKH